MLECILRQVGDGDHKRGRRGNWLRYGIHRYREQADSTGQAGVGAVRM